MADLAQTYICISVGRCIAHNVALKQVSCISGKLWWKFFEHTSDFKLEYMYNLRSKFRLFNPLCAKLLKVSLLQCRLIVIKVFLTHTFLKVAFLKQYLVVDDNSSQEICKNIKNNTVTFIHCVINTWNLWIPSKSILNYQLLWNSFKRNGA